MWTEAEKEILRVVQANLEDARKMVREAIINSTKIKSCRREVESLNSTMGQIDTFLKTTNDRIDGKIDE